MGRYDGMVLKGRMLADAYLSRFTTLPLPSPLAAADPAVSDPAVSDPAFLFPWGRCGSAEAAATDAPNVCWNDERSSEAIAQASRCRADGLPASGKANGESKPSGEAPEYCDGYSRADGGGGEEGGGGSGGSSGLGCGWTVRWRCPQWGAPAEGESAWVATDDGTVGYRCCCEFGLAREGPA